MRDTVAILASTSSCARRIFGVVCMLVAKVSSPEPKGMLILDVAMVGTYAGDMIGEITLAIEMGADAVDIGKTIHPHPTLDQSIGMAAEIAHSSCKDVPPARK